MHKVAASTIIRAPREKVWEALADFGNVYKMSKGVKSSHSTSEGPVGEGATRHCDLALMGAMVEERITAFDPPRFMEIEIYEWKKLPFMRRLSATFTLTEHENGTRLEGVFFWRLTRNPIGHLMNALMMKRMNRKAWIGFMAGLKHYVETGQEVTDDTKLELGAVSTAASPQPA